MSLSAKNRSALYQGLSTVVPEPEAVEEMLANFAAREDEEAASREFIRAEVGDLRGEVKADLANLRAEMAELRGELKGDIAGLRTEVKGDIAGLRTELKGDIGDLRVELHTELHRVLVWTVATNVSMFALLFTLLRLTA